MTQPHDRRIHADALRRHHRLSQWQRFKRQVGVMAAFVALGAIGAPYSMLDKDEQWAIGVYAYRSEEHTSDLQSLMRISYSVFCLKNKNTHSNPQRANATLINNE